MSSAPRPKVVFVTSIQTAGGGEGVLFELASQLPIDAVVAAPDGDVLDELRSRGVRVRRLRGPTELHRAFNRTWFLELIYRALISWIEIIWVIRAERPDVVHINNLAAGIYALPPAALLRKSRLWHIHDVVLAGSIEARLVHWLHRMATRIIVPSHASRAALIAIGVPEWRITILPSGVDARHRFNPETSNSAELRRELDIPATAILVAAIGQIAPGKGTDVLLDAIEVLGDEKPEADLHVVLVGAAPPMATAYERRLRTRVRQHPDLNKRIHILGPRQDIPGLLLDIDILVQPSVHPEAFGRSVAEALAMQRLVVAARGGALPELVEDRRTGYLFEPGDVQSLARILQHAIEQLPASGEITRAGRAKVLEEVDAHKRNERLTMLYREVQSRRKTHG